MQKRVKKPRSSKGKISKTAEKKKTKQKESEKETVTVKVKKKDPWAKTLHWSSRLLGLLIILFWTSFIVMSHGITTNALMEGIIIIALAAALLCAWRYEIAGGAIYLMLGIVYLVIAGIRMEWIALVLVATPPLVAGGLFITEGLLKIKR